MKKIFYIFIGIISVIIISFYIFNARERNTFPFNTKLGYLIPNSVKTLIYEILTPNNYSIITDKHNLEVTTKTIPNYNFKKKYGGALENINNENILYLSVEGNFYLFNLKAKIFTDQNITLEHFHNVRDIKLVKSKDLIAILGVKKNSNGCGTLKLESYKYKFSKNKLKIFDRNELWESEQNCKFNSKTSGARVEYSNNIFYVSTGIFQSPVNSGIIKENWSQKNNSSFGKIIKINSLTNKSEIFAKGFRNPQGLFFYKEKLLGTDHGPKGGDEINIIKYNSNYGWPCKSYGILYSKKVDDKNLYPTLDSLKEFEGCKKNVVLFTEPLYAFSNSVGISQGIEYNSNYFYNFKNNLLVSTLKGKSLYRIILNNNNDKIIQMEQIYLKKRIRDLLVTNLGKIVFISDKGFINIIELI